MPGAAQQQLLPLLLVPQALVASFMPMALNTLAAGQKRVEHLLPEWFAAFYVRGEPCHCIPIPALRSVLADQRFGGDWVGVARSG